MPATRLEGVCACMCHHGQYQFHVRWRPCCNKPVDAGRVRKVFELTIDGTLYPVIADTESEARDLMKSLGVSV